MKALLTLLFVEFACMALGVALFGTELTGRVIPAKFIVVCMITTVAFVLLVRSKFSFRAAPVFVIALLAIHCGIWTSRKQFAYDLAKIKAGMDAREVRAIMWKYHEGTGWPAAYGTEGGHRTLTVAGSGQAFEISSDEKGLMQIESSLVFRHDLKEADWGVIHFKSNHVVSVEFLPD